MIYSGTPGEPHQMPSKAQFAIKTDLTYFEFCGMSDSTPFAATAQR